MSYIKTLLEILAGQEKYLGEVYDELIEEGDYTLLDHLYDEIYSTVDEIKEAMNDQTIGHYAENEFIYN